MKKSIKTVLRDRETSQLFMKYSNEAFELFKKRCFVYMATSEKKIELVNITQTTEKNNIFKITFTLKDKDTTFKLAYYYDVKGKLTKRGFEEVNVGSILQLERFRKVNKLCNEMVRL